MAPALTSLGFGSCLSFGLELFTATGLLALARKSRLACLLGARLLLEPLVFELEQLLQRELHALVMLVTSSRRSARHRPDLGLFDAEPRSSLGENLHAVVIRSR